MQEDVALYANNFFRRPCTFIAGADKLQTVPNLSLAECAFIGRSNVGKSSLLNAITDRTNLARVSHTPGRTKQINFFNLADTLTLVDLPGYGYAKVSKREIANWSKLIYDYLAGRVQLARIYLLIDARHPVKASDVEVMKLLDNWGRSYQVVLTKTDKCTKSEIQLAERSMQELMVKHTAMYPRVIISSSKDKVGITDIRISILSSVGVIDIPEDLK
jgi:GTP-binding protein